jgi:formylglycine-generating enzyme required for sulfatase activity
MGKYEVTQGQWQATMGNNPTYFKGDDKRPVEQVSWNDTWKFINTLNEMNDGYMYRLPKEAEWEYACRAGTTGDYYAQVVDDIGWYSDNSDQKTHRVGSKQPNAFGLYDMSGNVLEWCYDWYVDTYESAPTDGSARLTGGEQKYRVLRGGSWNYFAKYLRSAGRNFIWPENRYYNYGFRLVAVVRTP